MKFDLLVRNGTVVDGTGAPRIEADIGIAGGRIAAIGQLDGGAEAVIDAAGLVVAGDFVRVPPGVPYAYRNPGDGAARLLVRAVSPAAARRAMQITTTFAA